MKIWETNGIIIFRNEERMMVSITVRRSAFLMQLNSGRKVYLTTSSSFKKIAFLLLFCSNSTVLSYCPLKQSNCPELSIFRKLRQPFILLTQSKLQKSEQPSPDHIDQKLDKVAGIRVLLRFGQEKKIQKKIAATIFGSMTAVARLSLSIVI